VSDSLEREMSGALLIALLAAAVAVCYAHYEIPRFTEGFVKNEVAHLVLLAVGLGFGAVSASMPDLPMPRWAAFAIGFGAVHVPAAAILFLKWLRGAGQS
jgi:hypothetical protein